jgi:tRNA dimethylallyltransferase
VSNPRESRDAATTARLPARVLVITGATAAGKTELAAQLARALGAEIVGADSRQVYRGMDAGTAKPPAELRREIPHHLIDVVDPDETYDVARWRAGANAALTAIEARGAAAIVCGGTGLYVRSLVSGLFAGPAADDSVRERLRCEEAACPGALHERLRSADPESAARIHPNDTIRIVRALEVLELTGRPISSWQREHGLAERPFETLTLELSVEPKELARRIEERSRRIVAAGIVDELGALYARGYSPGLKAFDAIGYREAAQSIAGAIARADLAATIAKATRAYAKRQRVWNRRYAGAIQLGADEIDRAVALARAFFDRVANSQGIG